MSFNHSLEESLKNFLADEQDDNSDLTSRNFYKYNNLKLIMEPHKNETPHVTVRIGISEATYELGTRCKISGGLGSDEKIIRKWLEKSHIQDELLANWELVKQTKPTISSSEYEE